MPTPSGTSGASPTTKNAAARPATGRSRSRAVRFAPRRHTATPAIAVAAPIAAASPVRKPSGMCTRAPRFSAAAAPTTNVTGGGSGAGSVAQRAAQDALLAARPAALIAAIGVSGARPPSISCGGDPADVAAAGEDHERAAEAGERVPVGRLGVLVVVVAVDERRGHARAGAASAGCRPRRARRARRTRRGRRATSMPASLQRDRLLAAARGDERVAALEPHDVVGGVPSSTSSALTSACGERLAAGRAADAVQLRVGRRERDDRVHRRPVVDDHARVADAAPRPRRVSSAGSPGPAPTRWTVTRRPPASRRPRRRRDRRRTVAGRPSCARLARDEHERAHRHRRRVERRERRVRRCVSPSRATSVATATGVSAARCSRRIASARSNGSVRVFERGL